MGQIQLSLVLNEIMLWLIGGPHSLGHYFLPCVPPPPAPIILGPQSAVVFKSFGCFC